MKIAYIVGNGTRNRAQIEYLGRVKGPDSIIIACHPAKWQEEWGFLPDVAGDLEMTYCAGETTIASIRRWKDCDTNGIKLYFVNWTKEFYPGANGDIHYIDLVGYSDHHRGYNVPGALPKFKGTGETFVALALRDLGCDRAVIIGCDGYYDVEHLNQQAAKTGENIRHESVNVKSFIGWNRLAMWTHLNFSDKLILNASLKTHISCFPLIRLGQEFQKFPALSVKGLVFKATMNDIQKTPIRDIS